MRCFIKFIVNRLSTHSTASDMLMMLASALVGKLAEEFRPRPAISLGGRSSGWDRRIFDSWTLF